MARIKIGEFEVVSGKVIVSDPCYKIGTWCQGVLERVRKDTWTAYVVLAADERVTTLLAFTGMAAEVTDRLTWQEVKTEIGVDSGQCGIFDATYYRDDTSVLTVGRIGPEIICPEEPWYSICCDRTLNTDHSAGVLPFGCVSSSGYGDGSYRCYIQKDDRGDAIGIKINFISDEETEGRA